MPDVIPPEIYYSSNFVNKGKEGAFVKIWI